MSDQSLAQAWQPFFMTLAGASATLAGLVFVAVSLHPQATLAHPLMRVRALVAALGFLLAVAWSLIMLAPARTAPLASLLLLTVGIVGDTSLVYQEIKARKLGLNRARVVVGDAVLLAPIVAGMTGLLLPASPLPFMVVAVAASVALFVLFSQSWTLMLHGILDLDAPHRSKARSGLPVIPPESERTRTRVGPEPFRPRPIAEGVVARRLRRDRNPPKGDGMIDL